MDEFNEMDSKGYYKVLEVKPDANQEEITKAYKDLVKEYHPDKHRDNPLLRLAEEKIRQANVAYEVLRDPEKRKNYDQRSSLNQQVKVKKQTPPTPKANSYKKSSQSFIKPEMVYINDGTFKMGSSDEKPFHSITVSNFYLGKYPVTNKEYCLYDSSHKNFGDNLPVVNVSWDDAEKYCNWLSNNTGNNYGLPTEAEWEYACRAGTTTNYYWGNKMDGSYCWYKDNSGGKVHSIGQKKPNKFGLYDMSGNLWEWCYDLYGNYSSCSVNNPTGPSSGSYRVFRGGSWNNKAIFCRSAFRGSGDPCDRIRDLGFRLSSPT